MPAKPVKRPVRIITGKGDFVKRVHADGKIEDICECIWNSEFSVRGCPMQCCGELLQEVVDNNGAYAQGNFMVYKKQGKINQKCSYCYGRRKNNGQVYPRKVDEVTRADFERVKPKVIRLGKVIECGHPYYYDTLRDFLELCKEFKTKIIFTTKTLPFGLEGALETEQYSGIDTISRLAKNAGMISGAEMAQKFRENGASLLYSLGFDNLEPGAVTQGFTNEWRIKQAERYFQQGVNTSLTIVCDATQSIADNEKAGSAIAEALESRERTGINIRILPLRINSQKVARTVTGKSMKMLVSADYHTGGMLPAFKENYHEQRKTNPYQYKSGDKKRRGNSEIIPVYFHPDIQGLIDSGVGVCGGVGDLEYCDKCNLSNEKIVFPRSELIEVKYKNKTPKLSYKEKTEKKHQLRFKFD